MSLCRLPSGHSSPADAAVQLLPNPAAASLNNYGCWSKQGVCAWSVSEYFFLPSLIRKRKFQTLQTKTMWISLNQFLQFLTFAALFLIFETDQWINQPPQATGIPSDLSSLEIYNQKPVGSHKFRVIWQCCQRSCCVRYFWFAEGGQAGTSFHI